MSNSNQFPKQKIFTPYQVFMIVVLAFIQFTVILDFMVLAPLGAVLLKELSLEPTQFGVVVSGYAFAAGVSGIIAAGFADKFDRKKFLLFFYVGFVLGTAMCAMATSYTTLLIARIVTGIFGGVVASIGFAIMTDLFKMEVRGRVMGFVQMSFAASQILGIPVGLYLATHYAWHTPFWLIAGLAALAGIVIAIKMKPITAHLTKKTDKSPFHHLLSTLGNKNYLFGFLTTTVLTTGGFMLMPFSSAFSNNNIGISLKQLPIVYLVTGISAMILGPMAGRLSDKFGKYQVFVGGSTLTGLLVLIYCNLGITPLWIFCIISILLFAGVTARMIAASTLISGLPEMHDRGAFMSINSSVQQLSGGIAAFAAGLVVSKAPDGRILHFDIIGYFVFAAMSVAVIMMYQLNKRIKKASAGRAPHQAPAAPVAEVSEV